MQSLVSGVLACSRTVRRLCHIVSFHIPPPNAYTGSENKCVYTQLLGFVYMIRWAIIIITVKNLLYIVWIQVVQLICNEILSRHSTIDSSNSDERKSEYSKKELLDMV